MWSLLVSTAAAAVIKVPVQHEYKHGAKDALSALEINDAELRASGKLSSMSTPTLFLDTMQDAYYYGKLSVGPKEKAAEFNVIYDTGSTLLWVPHVDCMGHNFLTKPLSACYLKNKLPADIVEFHEESQKFELHYGSGDVEAFACELPVHIGGVSLKADLPMGAATKLAALGIGYRFGSFDGIMGMGWPGLTGRGDGTPEAPALVQQMFEDGLVDDEVFGFFLDTNKKGGEITFGGANEDRYVGEITWLPVPVKLWWTLNMPTVAMEDLNLVPEAADHEHYSEGNFLAIVDSGTSMNVGSSAIVVPILRKMLAVLPEGKARAAVRNMVSIDCDIADLVPEVTFTLMSADGPREFSMQGKELVMETELLGQKACMIAMSPMDSLGSRGMPHMILGDPFMRKYYTIHDYGNGGRVGLALAKH